MTIETLPVRAVSDRVVGRPAVADALGRLRADLRALPDRIEARSLRRDPLAGRSYYLSEVDRIVAAFAKALAERGAT